MGAYLIGTDNVVIVTINMSTFFCHNLAQNVIKATMKTSS